MSISPTDAQNSQSFPTFPARFPNTSPRHGPRSRRPFPPPSFNAHSPLSAVAAQSAIEADGTSQISNVVAFGNRVVDTDESSNSENNGTFIGDRSTGRSTETSDVRSNQFGSAQGQGRASANANRHSRNIAADATDFRGNASQLAPRRNQVINANHLLNFYYDPISHSQPKDRVPPPRRQRKIKPYNKDLFVQANYKFVIVDRGDCHVESIDPDKMLQWEDVICVRYSTPFSVQCPICLESPLCPQITSCGHIYCFPCILQYMLMGEEDNKCECWKKCPLCFMMISTKSLYTVLIDNVKQYQIGDDMEFALITRQKNSLHPMIKEQQAEEPNVSNDILFDPFSKFVLTSDVELSVREAKVDLQSWLQKADSGLVDDLEKLPYVCAALEQLDDRMRSWVDHHIYGSSPLGKHSSPPINPRAVHTPSKTGPNVTNLNSDGKNSRLVACQPAGGTLFSGLEHDKMSSTAKFNSSSSDALRGDAPEHLDGLVESLQSSSKEQSNQNTSNNGNTTERDSYIFYQVTDGQHLILHPLNMKCLLHHYGSYDNLPQRVSGKILELETVTQTEAMRRRYRYLSHFSLTTTFQLCEIDLTSTIPPSSLVPFRDEIKKRDKNRRQLARKEEDQRVRAEAAFMHMNPIPSDLRQLPVNDVEFLAADFEALGSNFVPPSSSPPTSSGRISFSHVARLGFAAAHDSPSLRAEEVANLSGDSRQSSTTQGPTTMATLSFANIITSDRVESPNTEKNASAKKGKKPSKVLLTTSGGRRY